MFGRKQQMKYNINTYQIYFKENKIFTSPKNLIVYKEHTFNFQKNVHVHIRILCGSIYLA